MPPPDQRTLFLVLLLATFLFVVVMFLVHRAQRHSPASRTLAPGAALAFVGVVLFLLRGRGPDLLAVVLSNSAIIASFILVSHSVHLMIGRPSPRRFFQFIGLAVPLLLAFFNYLIDYFPARVLVYSLAMAPLMLELALTLYRASRGQRSQVYKFLALCFLACGLFMFVRAAYTGLTGDAPAFFDPSLMFSMNLLVHLFAILAMTVGLPLLMSVRLAADLEAHVADLRDEIGMRRQAEERLAREAALDPLTGLYNRRKFFSEAGRCLSQARRYTRPLSVIILDVDYFKGINDTHGHEVGDRVLVALANYCQGQMRAADVLARFGGEEFVALLPDTDQAGALAMAERLRQGLAGLRLPSEQGQVRITASFGVSQLAPGEDNLRALIARADQALYAAKLAGRDQVRAHADI